MNDSLPANAEAGPMAALIRFPVALAALAVFTGQMIFGPTPVRLGTPNRADFTIGFIALGLCFWAVGAVRLAESRGWDWFKAQALAAAGLGPLLLFVLFNHPVDGAGPAPWLFLGLMAVLGHLGPYLDPDKIPEDGWRHDARYHRNLIIGLTLGLLMGLGLMMTLELFKYLFGFRFPGQVCRAVLAICATFVGPFLILMVVPRGDEAPETLERNGLSLWGLARWLPWSLLLMTALLIYAVGFKAAFSPAWPEIGAGWLAAVYGLAAVGGYIFGRDGHDDDQAWTGFFGWRLFVWLLPGPIVLLLAALHRQISTDGLTESTALLLLTAPWLIFCWLAALVKSDSSRWIAGGLLVMLLAASLGPLNVTALASRSQFKQLERVLKSHGLLAGNRIVVPDPPPAVSGADRRKLQALARFFYPDRHYEYLAARLMTDPPGDGKRRSRTYGWGLFGLDELDRRGKRGSADPRPPETRPEPRPAADDPPAAGKNEIRIEDD